MKYLLLIYSDEAEMAKMNEAEQKELMDAHWAYSGALQEAGIVLGGEALQPTTTAKSVRVHKGKTIATDGPFAETKEQLGGFYMIEVETEAEAVEWAAKLPGSDKGTIEVRGIVEYG